MLNFAGAKIADGVKRGAGGSGKTAMAIADYVMANPGCSSAEIKKALSVSALPTDYSAFQSVAAEGDTPLLAVHETRPYTGTLLARGIMLVKVAGGWQTYIMDRPTAKALKATLQGSDARNTPNILKAIDTFLTVSPAASPKK